MEQNISLTSNNKSVSRVVRAVQGDTGRVLSISLDRTDLTASMTYNAVIEKPSGLSVYIPASYNASTNTISVTLTNQALAEEGNAKAQIEVTDTTGKVTTYAFYLAVEKALRDDTTIRSTAQYSAIDSMAQACATVKAQLDTAMAAVTTSTEITDIRVKNNGDTATTAGNAVREQVDVLMANISRLDDYIYDLSDGWINNKEIEFYQGYFNTSTNAYVSNGNNALIKRLAWKNAKATTVKRIWVNPVCDYRIIKFATATGAFYEQTAWTEGNGYFAIGADIPYIVIVLKMHDGTACNAEKAGAYIKLQEYAGWRDL